MAAVSYFRGAFSRDFTESKLGAVSIPDEDLATFLVVVHWLYTCQILTPSPRQHSRIRALTSPVMDVKATVVLSEICPGAGTSGRLDKELEKELHLDLLVSLFVFGDRRNSSQLRNDAMTTAARMRKLLAMCNRCSYESTWKL
ncbi:hypothetical protein EJ03DRAFT_197674 [Teratosphaeria nubilosa]|uniref:BTB domain-containing protein n=1 Tax=Teratosphaeria nubilosa TaxID=161662 RepID=A0A6G1KZA1_9PEZI|nr:hypothetical protein EJ03DRAFT_197674 [Teratosphaeria nubilosa]